jgi:multiple sugar transport system substrate-binding protein
MKNIFICLLMIVTAIVGCNKKESAAEKPLVFWHAMSGEKAIALRAIIDDYNAANPPITIREEFVGDYDTLYRKTMSALMAKRPPDIAMAYESMVTEYMKYNAVADLTAYLNAETPESVDDLYPMFLESNRFSAFNNQLLSMPFTKSILMFYYNADMLDEIGLKTPPATWSEFIDACKKIKAKRNITPLAFARDASTFDGLVYSFGGEVFDTKTGKPLFDQPATLQALTLIHDLFTQNLAKETAYGTYDDRNEFVNQQAAFFIRSSTSRPYTIDLANGNFKWNMTVLPHGDAISSPRTVLFGPNLCVFKSDSAREQAAWNFIQYFTSSPVTARWATQTGYLPVRKSALNEPALKEFLTKHPANRQTIDAIPFASSEPTVRGWQEVRSLLEKAMSEVISNRQSPQQAAQTLQKEALRILEK